MTKLHLKFKVGKGAEKKLDEIGKLISNRMKLALASSYFEKNIKYRVEKNRVVIYTDNDILTYIEKGTKPHKIPVGKKGFLAFQVGHSGGKSKAGDWVYTKKAINHPGTDPRPFFSQSFLTSKPGILKILNRK